MRPILATFETFHLEISPLNNVAPKNMLYISVTLDTSHFEMSVSKFLAFANMKLVSATPDMFHSPIGPCRPLEQLPCDDNCRQAATALLSSVLDCGEKTEYLGINAPLPAQKFGEMEVRSVRNRSRRCNGKIICTCCILVCMWMIATH